MSTMTASTASETNATPIGQDDIASTAQLRREAERAEQVLEDFTALLIQLGTWANELPERYVAAPFGTEKLTAAINHVTEAQGDAGQIGEALAEITEALGEADGLGEKVSEIQADGNVGAFTTE